MVTIRTMPTGKLLTMFHGATAELRYRIASVLRARGLFLPVVIGGVR
jgi:hypothetical protein